MADDSDDGRAGRASVVLVDDNADLLILLEHMFEREAFYVLATARDGQAGIEVVQEHQPDVVVLDLAMPKLDGEAALPLIIEASPRSMVVILSAHVDEERAVRLLGAGAFSAHTKGNLFRLPTLVGEDLARYRRKFGGADADRDGASSREST